jgi:hypothetical protein
MAEPLPPGFVLCPHCKALVLMSQWAEPHTDEACFEGTKERLAEAEQKLARIQALYDEWEPVKSGLSGDGAMQDLGAILRDPK